jgi:hypothetical protein
MSSRNCPLKLQASIATQSQMLLEIDIIAAALVAPIAPTVPTAPIAPIAPIAAAALTALVLKEPIVSTAPMPKQARSFNTGLLS